MVTLPDVQKLNDFTPDAVAPQAALISANYTPGLKEKGMEQGAADVTEALGKLQDLHNEAAARDRQNQLQEWGLQQDLDFKNQYKGADAVKMLPQQLQAMDAQTAKLSEGLSPDAQRTFQNEASANKFRLNSSLANYAASQYADSIHQTADASKVLAVKGAQANPHARDTYQKQYEDAAVLQAKNQGGGADAQEAARQTAATEFNKKYIEALPTDQQLKILKPIVDSHTGTAIAKPDDAINYVITNYEGSALNPNDSGKGPSKYGILGSANGLTDDQVKNLTQAQAAAIYKKNYWDKIGADSLPDNMKLIAFDTAVNFGVGAASNMIAASDGDPKKLLQLREEKHAALVAAHPETYGPAEASWKKRDDDLATTIGAGTGAPVGDWRDSLPPQEATQMYHAAAAQQEIASKVAEMQQKQVAQKAQDEYLVKALNGQSTDGLVTDTRLNFEQRNQVIEAASRAARFGTETNPQVFNDAFMRIVDPTRPDKITAPSQLLPLIGKGLGYEDYNKLKKELGSDEGDAMMKKQFFETAKAQISGTNEAFAIKDPQGDERYLKWMAQTLPVIQAETAKGKTLTQLFDPNSADYLGKNITQFKRPAAQQRLDMQQTGGRNLKQIIAEYKAEKDPKKQAALREEAISLGLVAPIKPKVPEAQ